MPDVDSSILLIWKKAIQFEIVTTYDKTLIYVVGGEVSTKGNKRDTVYGYVYFYVSV